MVYRESKMIHLPPFKSYTWPSLSFSDGLRCYCIIFQQNTEFRSLLRKKKLNKQINNMDLSRARAWVCMCAFLDALNTLSGRVWRTSRTRNPCTLNTTHNGARLVWRYYNYYYYLFMTTCQSVTSSERVRGYAAFVFQYYRVPREASNSGQGTKIESIMCDAIGRQCCRRIGYA